MRVISIGEILWDVLETAEHLGGAPFNFAANLTQLGHEAWFVSAVGNDARGDRILEEMRRRGLSTEYVHRDSNYPTGFVTVSLGSNGQPSFVIHRPVAYDFPQLNGAQLGEISSRNPQWIYFGTLQQTSSQARQLAARLLEMNPGARRFYDVNLRKGCYDATLVRDLSEQADIVKVNDEEVVEIARMLGARYTTIEEFCRLYLHRFELEAICVTRGAHGCALLCGDEYAEIPGYSIKVCDAIGAGDAFAAAFLDAFSRGLAPAEIADFANRVGAVVASKPGALPSWTVAEALALR